MKIIVSPGFVRLLLPRDVAAMAFYPFIILGDEALRNDAVFLQHERIHLRQQAELLLLFFLILYLIEFIVRLVQYRNVRSAYYAISFEKEAYAQETNSNYLKTRKAFSFIKYW